MVGMWRWDVEVGMWTWGCGGDDVEVGMFRWDV